MDDAFKAACDLIEARLRALETQRRGASEDHSITVTIFANGENARPGWNGDDVWVKHNGWILSGTGCPSLHGALLAAEAAASAEESA